MSLNQETFFVTTKKMPLTKKQKQAVVAEIETQLKAQQSAAFVDFAGLKVREIQQIKKAFKVSGVTLKVYKKSLIGRALKNAGLEVDVDQFQGSLGLVTDAQDEVGAAKHAAAAGKKFNLFKILGGLFQGQFATVTEMTALASIPSREALLATLLNVCQGPVRGLVTALNETIAGLVRVLDAKAKKS